MLFKAVLAAAILSAVGILGLMGIQSNTSIEDTSS